MRRPPARVFVGWLARVREAPVTTALVAANLAAFAASTALGALTDETVLLRIGALERSLVWAGQPWRLVVAPFLHAGLFHLSCNILFCWLACRLVERALGGAALAGLYVASAVGGSALSLLGQDGISVGASGALFGIVGAILALHLRALRSLRAFLSSRATRDLAGGILVTTLLAPLVVRVDHLAHAGGLATGAVGAWLFSSPRPGRRWPWAAAVGVYLAVVAAACSPRGELTRWQRAQLEVELDSALRARDVPAARALLTRADAAGASSERLDYYRVLLLVQEDALEPALAAARPLLNAREKAVRREGARIVGEVAKVLAYRSYTGEGAPRDPWRALAYMDEACLAGDAHSCDDAARVRGAAPP
jgi:rhomboid protease GluP